MLNGRILRLSGEDLTNFLHSISADDIERVEVITTPPARYEAEGDSGLIDIVLKKARADSWSHSLRTRYVQTPLTRLTGLGILLITASINCAYRLA